MSQIKKVWRCSPAEDRIEQVSVYADTPIDEWMAWYSTERYIYTETYEEAVDYMLFGLGILKHSLKLKLKHWKEVKADTLRSSVPLDNA